MSPDIIYQILDGQIKNFFSLIYQSPWMDSISLIASIQRDIVFPKEVILSNILNSLPIPFVSYPSIGKIISQILNPSIGTESVIGYGYYILTEGYNFLGWIGIIYNAVSIKVVLSIWDRFVGWGDKEIDEYMLPILVMSLLGFIRGQGSSGIKVIFYAFIPSILIFLLISKKRVGRNKIFGDQKLVIT